MEGGLTYKIIQIKIIDPYDSRDLQIVSRKDLATLLTCDTPGVPNNKRLVLLESEFMRKNNK